MKKIKDLFSNNIVTVMFLILCTAAIVVADQTPAFLFEQIVQRLFRNGVLVLSLIIPVLAGLGLNFGIVLGAMSAQTAMIMVTYWKVEGVPGLVLALAVSTPIAILLGVLIGRLFNKTKGQEMITGMILGFFANGVYQFIFMVLVGGIIPLNNPDMTISGGIGLLNTMKLSEKTSGAFDKLIRISLDQAFLYGFVLLLAVFVWKLFAGIRKREYQSVKRTGTAALVYGAVLAAVRGNAKLNMAMAFVDVPVFTALLVILVALFTRFIINTKLGQDFRSVGQNMKVAVASGINVDKTRIIAIVISTVLASFGQIISIQNIGNFATYTAHEQVATFAIAALLVGGASIKKANVSHAFLGILLFHTLFTVAPMAGANLFNDTQIGEYFRVFVSYGVIALALLLHTAKAAKQRKLLLEQEQQA
ncbi:ABC transporter permease [Clostridium sp. MCC353]|uniref:ABC transporter permease subunit n=1 Tax=Clostridium sp. MCC353 TaxID=2592646 RepID=UPI001C01BEF2|nr:ABC transporter permease [Clostridium sp. MCC353]